MRVHRRVVVRYEAHPANTPPNALALSIHIPRLIFLSTGDVAGWMMFMAIDENIYIIYYTLYRSRITEDSSR